MSKSGATSKVFPAFALALASGVASNPLSAQQMIDITAYFQRAEAARGAGLARKTKPVDARPANPGEVVVTIIKGEGKETQSAPAKPGDMVVRNRCPATGNEQILVTAGTFARRYDGPVETAAEDGWRTYRPRGVEMRFVEVDKGDGTFTFLAPWGERMIARPGDVIVQDATKVKDTYRIARAAFECTYEVQRQPTR